MPGAIPENKGELKGIVVGLEGVLEFELETERGLEVGSRLEFVECE